MHFADAYEAQYQAFVAAHDAHVREINRLAAEERAHNPDLADHQLALRSFDVVPSDKALTCAAYRIAERITDRAAREFAPAGKAKLALDTSGLIDLDIANKRRHPHDRDIPDVRSFSPSRLWQQLTERYGGEAGTHAGYHDTAEQLVRAFRLDHTENMRTVRGWIRLDLAVTEDPIDKRFGAPGRLTVHDFERVPRVLNELGTVATQASLGAAASALRTFADDMPGRRQDPITSGARYTLGEDVLVITYKSRFEVRVSPRFAQALQVFLGRYASDQVA